ncbi:ABC transporter permease [Paenibacillus terrigena]|uniref:ABC transporter permease n=1 Tax=Paenibacillus terrigena TaxID=369333 RepID=UPI0028D118C1|nr:ABC transporter permease [Paenibacillus terrigena]
MASMFVHGVFLVFLVIVYIGYGNAIDLYKILNLLYYDVCMTILVLGLGFLTSSIIVFFKDLGQIVAIILQLGMWLTPIMWSTKLIPFKYQWLFEINPMYYIVEGYRNSLLFEKYGVGEPILFLWFWGLTIFTSFLGIYVFKKLKPHFSDVL